MKDQRDSALTNVDPLIPAAERDSTAKGVTCLQSIKDYNKNKCCKLQSQNRVHEHVKTPDRKGEKNKENYCNLS